MRRSDEPAAARCAEVIERLADWAELDPAARAALVAHAEDCPTCGPELAAWRTLFERLDASRHDYRSLQYTGRPLDLERLRPRPSRTGVPWRLPARLWAPLAAVLIVALAGILWSTRIATGPDSRIAETPPAEPQSVRPTAPAPRPLVQSEAASELAEERTPDNARSDSAGPPPQARPLHPAPATPASALPVPVPVPAPAPPTAAPPATAPGATAPPASVSPTMALAALGAQARRQPAGGPPSRPSGLRWSMPPRPVPPPSAAGTGSGGASA